jgi:hypothetical protein
MILGLWSGWERFVILTKLTVGAIVRSEFWNWSDRERRKDDEEVNRFIGSICDLAYNLVLCDLRRMGGFFRSIDFCSTITGEPWLCRILDGEVV